MIELVVVILVGSILMSIALRGFGDTTSGFAVRSARQVFLSLQARARSHAIERGTRVRLTIDPSTDIVAVTADGATITQRDFDEEMGIDILGPAGQTFVTMTPRGFGDADQASFSTTAAISFTQGSDTLSVTLLPLGQVQW